MEHLFFRARDEKYKKSQNTRDFLLCTVVGAQRVTRIRLRARRARIVSAPMPAPLERSGGGSCALTGAAGNRSRAENVLKHNKYSLRITRNGRNYP